MRETPTAYNTRPNLGHLEDLCSAAQMLLDAHRERNGAYQFATLNEEAAVWQIRSVLDRIDESIARLGQEQRSR